MKRTLTVHQEGNAIYQIILDTSFGQLASEICKLEVQERRICIVTDSTVAELYLKEVK